MPGSFECFMNVGLFDLYERSYGVGTILIPILQMRKVR